MARFSGVFKNRPNSLLIAFLANQLKAIITSRKSSSRRVTPLPREAPYVLPTAISGDNSIEKINIYSPSSILMKDILKIANARPPQIKTDGGICEDKKPNKSARTKKDMLKKINRMVRAYILSYQGSGCFFHNKMPDYRLPGLAAATTQHFTACHIQHSLSQKPITSFAYPGGSNHLLIKTTRAIILI